MNILVVDDERFQLQGLRLVLRSWGYGVLEALSAVDALNLLESHRSEVDLVITDYSMPVMDGIELLKAIRARIEGTPVILMTAYGNKDLILEALRLRFDGFIEKPVSTDDLKREIERITTNARKDADARKCSHQIPELAHQINNPLMSIMGSAELGLLNIDAPEATKKCLVNILAATETIKKMNMEVMALGRSERFNVGTIDVREVLDACLDMFMDLILLKGIKVNRVIEGDELCLSGDSEGFEQMLTNLLLNAIDAMDGEPERRLSVRAERDRRSLLISVEDTGCGIPQEQMDKIFKPYFTLKRNGNGIGLAVVKDVVEQHKGEIEVESLTGKGTVMKVIFPVQR